MIDKISGNGNYEFPGNQKRKNPAVRAYENTPGSKQELRNGGSKAAKKNRQHDAGEAGVFLDLSKHTGSHQAAPAVSKRTQTTLPNVLRRLFAPVVHWLKDFWGPGRLAEDAQESVQQAEDDNPQQAAVCAAAQAADDEVGLAELDLAEAEEDVSVTTAIAKEQKELADQVLKSGDLRQVEQFLTQNGTKRLAHNSDLLTYYDRRGKFVEMDETEKHRVLFGDKNVLKL